MLQISFIMTVYNTRKEWLGRSVESIKKQTNPEWELIIVDDGSRNEIAQYCDKLAEADTKLVVHHQKNSGVTVARNYGKDHAKGNWVVFIDSDDWIEETYVEQIMSLLSKYSDLDALAIGHDDIWEAGTIEHLWGNEEFHLFEASEKEGMQLALMQFPKGLTEYPMFFGAQWKFVYSLSFLKQYKICNIPGLSKSEDAVFNLYVTEYAQKIGYYNKVLYHYFHNDESVTSKKFNRDLEWCPRVVLANKKFLKDTNKFDLPIFKIAYRKYALMQFETLIYYYFGNKDNPDTYRQRKEKMRKILENEPYDSLLQSHECEGLSLYGRCLMFLLRNNMCYFSIFIYHIKCAFIKFR